MSMLEWAKREVELLKEAESKSEDPAFVGYAAACAENALQAFEILCEGGHSGMSIQITKSYLNRLIDGNPLTAIEDIPENWNLVEFNRKGHQTFQCNRCSSLFKDIYAGEVTFSDNQRYICIDIHNGSSYTGGGASDIIDELYPITMPYWPQTERIKLYAEDFLVDPAIGDFDTKGYLYLVHPEHGQVEINRYFKETKDGWKEIDEEEYELRRTFKYVKEDTSNE